MNSLERFTGACRALDVDRPPLWIMRQAGRALPEYRALREQHSFWQLMTTPELAAEVTLQPVRRFPLDAAIIFSDILVVPAAMGMEVSFTPQLAVAPAITSAADVSRLRTGGAAEQLGYVCDAIRIVRRETAGRLAVLGFAGAPYTVASYMVEGGSSKSYQRVKSLMFRHAADYAKLMAAVVEMTVEYLQAQIEAGVDAVQLFDSWAAELSIADYRRFALPFVQEVVQRLAATKVPVIYFINGMGNLLEAARDSGASVLGVDWRLELADVRRRIGLDSVLQGNLDPGVLFAEPEQIRQRTQAMLSQTGGRGHIVNLGHGLLPDTPLEGIQAFVDAVLNWSN